MLSSIPLADAVVAAILSLVDSGGSQSLSHLNDETTPC
jgi:hypothetical protein